MRLPQEIISALKLLHEWGHEAFVVGGCVRDALMGKAEKDFDITTSAKPSETCDVFKEYKIIETGLKHGTVTVIINHIPIEITTYRIDGEYEDNRRPSCVSFTASLVEDLARRDFTINAICYNEEQGFIDYFGGMDDIKNKVIRAVGQGEKRFTEDALRILRALRFSAVLGFEIHEETADAIHKTRNLLENIAVERISSELNKILLSHNIIDVFSKYLDVFAVFMPEILDIKGFEQKNPYHCFDVLHHTLVATQAVAPVLHLRLAMLLHDIGKPQTFQLVEGRGHFYGHGNESVKLADKILKRLKYDTFTRERVLILIEHHDLAIECKRSAVKKQLSKLGEQVFLELIQVKIADCIGQNPDYQYRIAHLESIKELATEILNEQECFSLKQLAIGGRDLLEMGFPQGNIIAKTLHFLLNAVIEGACPNERDALLLLAKEQGKSVSNG